MEIGPLHPADRDVREVLARGYKTFYRTKARPLSRSEPVVALEEGREGVAALEA